MEPQSNCLFITFVEKEGPFLKVWGQTDKATSLYIEQVLHGFSSEFDKGFAVPHPESLQTGILCCAKYKDNKYYRAKITNLEFLQNRYIEVNFIDYGNRDVVPITNIRSLDRFENNFVSIPPQSSAFLLAEAVCPRGEWNDLHLDEICKEVRYSEVNFSIVAQVTTHFLVRLFVGVNDLAILLISKGLMRHTSLTTQEAVLLSMMPRVQAPPSMQQNIATYKAFTLEPGSQYEIYVSYVTDGPCNFSVQLKQSEEILAKLMKEINSMTLCPIEGVPIPGTVCLARCVEDGHICRAVVTNEVDGQFKVFYVDFGNFEVVPLESLYDIPFKYVIPKVMAIRFALAGVEKGTVTLEMQCAFKQFVDNHLMHMKVMPLTTRSSLPRCELWDPVSQTTALDIVNQAAAMAYPEHISLTRGFTQSVKISYVFSCSRFYVQLKAKQDDLLRLMLDIQASCKDGEVLRRELMKVGLPCYALYEGDQQWYRSQIVEIFLDGTVKVHYVDYGNDEVVAVSLLKPIEGKQLTVLRPQAIECCLNGYQNMETDIERDNLLEELILEKDFTMKVVEMQGKKALIELIDNANYNVASLLLDKIATTRSQVSPLLVQAGNKIEHRKSYSAVRESFKKVDKWVDRGRNWGDSTNETGWRQEGKGHRTINSGAEPNEINENNTWRQVDTNVNKSFEKNKRDDNLNDSAESDKSFSKNDRNRNEYNSRNKENDGSWRQNNKGFSKDERPNRDNNKNDGEKSNWNNNKEKNDWSGNRDNKRAFNKRDNWGDDQNDNRDNSERKPFTKDRDNFRKPREEWNSDSRKPRDEWNNDSKDKGSYSDSRKPRDDWNNDSKDKGSYSDSRKPRDDWNNDSKDKGSYRKPREEWNNESKDRDGFRKPRDWNSDSRERKPRDEWNNDSTERDNFKKPREWNNDSSGFKKRPDFKREKSELSSSGSENNFKKGFRGDNSRPPKRDNFKKFDRSPKTDFGGGDTWGAGASTSTAAEVPNPAPNTAKFDLLNVNNTEGNVVISWFHNPGYFYVQMENTQDEFKKMMENIQESYKDYSPGKAVVGAPVIGLFPEDNVLYRAEVLEVIGSQTKIYYVDFGNVSIIDKVWPIETRFMQLPVQAVCCKLEGVEAPGDAWPDAGSLGAYFNKRQFYCRFGATENDKVAVKLENEGEDIGGLLVRDGLGILSVVAAPPPPPPPELPLLIGQQFRAMLLSFNSLADFIVSLQSGMMLSCGIFNLEVSTETFEVNLKDKVEQILIVYVDDLKNDRLEVTLYDETGQKIKLIDKDEEAYETVETLCPYTILYSTITGEVTHIENNTLYIQPSESAESIEYLLNTAFEYYENITQENPIIPVEGFIYAVRGSDSNWYRAKVVSFDDTTINVNYFDYGNSEDVEIGALRELTAEFMDMPILCIPVTINPDPTSDVIGQIITLELTFTENGIEATLPVLPAPTDEATPQYEEPVYAAPVEEAPVEAAPVEAAVPITETTPDIPDTQGTKVILSHADSPSDFYLQLAESLSAIDDLQAILQEQVVEMADLENPVFGVLCAAPYSLDQMWYRAQVLDADSDITTVRFVDYGNTDVLDNSVTRVKTLPPNLLSLEVYTTRCRLKIKPVEEEWPSTASERFEELANAESLTVEFIHQDEKTNYVELFSNGVSVSEVLINENLAVPDEIQQETKSVGFVSHLNSPSEFWIQLENCIDELEWVAEQLSGAENFSELEDLAPGTLCAALFPDDQMWYRARILSNTVAGIEVLFVDYGNSCTSCSLRELPEDLVMLPPLAQKCSLLKAEGLNTWGPEMVRKFSEISADGQTTFNVKKLSTGETASVELLLDGVNVAEMIIPEVVEVKIKEFEGLDAIFLEEREGKFKLENLQDAEWGDESLEKFSEMVDPGKTVFQCEFVTEDTIRLYLAYNDIRLDLNVAKTITPSSSPLKTRTLEPQTHSSDITSISGVHDIVGDIIESSFDKEKNQNFVQSIMTDIIKESTGENESYRVAESVLGHIVEQSATDIDTKNYRMAESLVEDIVQQIEPSKNNISERDDLELKDNENKASDTPDPKTGGDSDSIDESGSENNKAGEDAERPATPLTPNKLFSEKSPNKLISDESPVKFPSENTSDGHLSDESPNKGDLSDESPTKGHLSGESPTQEELLSHDSPRKEEPFSDGSPKKEEHLSDGSPKKDAHIAGESSQQDQHVSHPSPKKEGDDLSDESPKKEGDGSDESPKKELLPDDSPSKVGHLSESTNKEGVGADKSPKKELVSDASPSKVGHLSESPKKGGHDLDESPKKGGHVSDESPKKEGPIEQKPLPEEPESADT